MAQVGTSEALCVVAKFAEFGPLLLIWSKLNNRIRIAVGDHGKMELDRKKKGFYLFINPKKVSEDGFADPSLI